MRAIHAVLMALGSHGDILPMIGLGRLLKSRGHRVTMLVNEHFRPAVESAGLDLIPLGVESDYQAALQRPNLHHPFWGLLGVSDLISNHFPHMYARLRQAVASASEPTVLVGTTLCFPMLCLKEKTGIPAVMIHLAPALLRSSLRPPQLCQYTFDPMTKLESGIRRYPVLRRLQQRLLDALWWTVDFAVADLIFARPLNRFRRTLDLKPVRRVLHHHIHSGDLVLGLFPDWFNPNPGDWPAQFRGCDFPLYDQEQDTTGLSPELEAFLAQGDRPIVFTGGTAFPNLQRFYGESAEACRLLGQRGILVTRYPQNIPPRLPSGVLAVPYAQFSLLFPRCKVVVHHGGIGTTSQALRAGIPQLIQPMAFDQFDNAARCQQLGVAQWLTTSQYRAAKVAATLEKLFLPRAVDSASRVGDRMRRSENPLQVAAEHIESLV